MSEDVRLCARCGARSRVLDTRPTAAGRVWRRRECPGCSARWTTTEVGQDKLRAVLKRLALLERERLDRTPREIELEREVARLQRELAAYTRML